MRKISGHFPAASQLGARALTPVCDELSCQKTDVFRRYDIVSPE
jgi:hypothetical protein